MAIDTRAKRQSAAQIGCPLPVSVLPSGAIAQADRQQISWTYRGILVATVVVVVPTPTRVGTRLLGSQERPALAGAQQRPGLTGEHEG